MPQSLSQIWIHIVFSTKNRTTFLSDQSFREEMFRMLSYHVSNSGCVSGSVGGHVDHVHLLVGLSRTIAVAKLVENIKTETSKWAKDSEKGFSWQSGYGVFSVSHSKRQSVEAYIRNQAEHHQKRSFKEEFRLMCSRHGIEIDERYVWD